MCTLADRREKTRQVLSDRAPHHEETIMGWITQPYFEDCLEQGRVQGWTEGQVKSLVRVLDERFGTLPEQLRARVSDADAQSLDAWFDRVSDAPDLQAAPSATASSSRASGCVRRNIRNASSRTGPPLRSHSTPTNNMFLALKRLLSMLPDMPDIPALMLLPA
jgi:hypothetical protein